MRRALALATLGAALLAATPRASAMPPGEDGRALRTDVASLEASVPEPVAADVERLYGAYPDDADVAFARALLHFLLGDYATAVTEADRSIAGSPHAADLAERRDLRATFADTRDATASFVESRSADGRFVVRYAPGPEAVLVPYALDTLVRADRAVSEVLGTRVPGPVRLELYRTPQALSRVSRLSVEDIERTGTVALCKWNRLMVTSPRALVRGYPWADTIGHEYVHLVLTRASRDRAPVWLQEGTAKLLEQRWRGGTGPLVAEVPEASRALLDAAVRDGHLLPFDRLHPSIALLPSQEDAALAFAQVSTFVEVYVATHGLDAYRAAIAAVAAGADARDALSAAAHEPFATLETEWKAVIAERARADGRATVAAAPATAMRFRHGDGPTDDTLDVRSDEARRRLRLGDLLWSREHAAAAATEYAQAAAAAPDDPIVASRLAHAALAAGHADRALEPLRRAALRDPESEPVQALLAAALQETGDAAGARLHAVEAIRVNPFDPQPHCVLGDLGADAPTREREAATCRSLGAAAH